MTRLFWNASSRNVLTCNFLAPQKVEEKRFCLFFQKNNSPFKTRIATACACPKMFATEQRYSPESDPLTLFKSKFLLETAEWLICDWLRFILLHTTAGSGLPLTEHWNEAVFFFFFYFFYQSSVFRFLHWIVGSTVYHNSLNSVTTRNGRTQFYDGSQTSGSRKKSHFFPFFGKDNSCLKERLLIRLL